MTKRIISILLVSLLALGLASCKIKNPEPGTIPTEEVATHAPSTTQPTTVETTQEETTTEPTTTMPTTTKPTTIKPTTTKKITTTVKKVVTTIKTTAAETTVPKVPTGNYRTENKNENLALKYGVFCARTTRITYIEYEDGTEEVYDEDVTEVFSRLTYSATYNDLLPAAKENKEKYASEIKQVLEIINGFRAEGGLKPVVLDERLTTIACARAEEIAWSGKFSHYRPNGKYFATILMDAGVESGLAGENIARRSSDVVTVCEAWKKSETHYANIMKPEFTMVGIGVAADPDVTGKLCWSQLFIDKLD